MCAGVLLLLLLLAPPASAYQLGSKPPTLGVQPLALVRVNGASTPSAIASAGAIVSTYYNQISGGLIQLVPTPVYTLTATMGCLDQSAYKLANTYVAIIEAQNGVSLASVNYIMLVTPAGCATAGGAGSAWISESMVASLYALKHETGHALGFVHSHRLDCPQAYSLTPPYMYPGWSNCSPVEYGDTSSVMNGSSTLVSSGYGITGVQAAKADWIQDALRVTASGRYRLTPLDSIDPSKQTGKLIQVPIWEPTGPFDGTSQVYQSPQYLWLSYRVAPPSGLFVHLGRDNDDGAQVLVDGCLPGPDPSWWGIGLRCQLSHGDHRGRRGLDRGDGGSPRGR